MNTIIIENIPFEINIDHLLKYLHMDKNSNAAKKIIDAAEEARSIAKPKALYRQSYIDSSGDDFVVIDGVTLQSRIMGINLNGVGMVFPFAATCGKEIEEWSSGFDNYLDRFWADHVKTMALGSAVNSLNRHVEENFSPGGKMSMMNPGSLKDWPITEQEKLFTIIGDSYMKIGIKLTESFMMFPLKTVSGIMYPSEEKFINCQLCARENCQGRRAPYDEHLHKMKYENIASSYSGLKK